MNRPEALANLSLVTTRRLAASPAQTLTGEELETETMLWVRGAVQRLRPGHPDLDVLGDMATATHLLSERTYGPAKRKKGASKQEQEDALVEQILLSIEQVAKMTGFGKTHIRALTTVQTDEGGILSFKSGRRIVIPAKELTAWIERELRRQNRIA